jgi:hypothetical protein
MRPMQQPRISISPSAWPALALSWLFWYDIGLYCTVIHYNLTLCSRRPAWPRRPCLSTPPQHLVSPSFQSSNPVIICGLRSWSPCFTFGVQPRTRSTGSGGRRYGGRFLSCAALNQRAHPLPSLCNTAANDCLAVDCVLCAQELSVHSNSLLRVTRHQRLVVCDACFADSAALLTCSRALPSTATPCHPTFLQRPSSNRLNPNFTNRNVVSSHFSRAGMRGSSSPTIPSSVFQITCCRPKRILCRCCRGEFIAVGLRAKWRRRCAAGHPAMALLIMLLVTMLQRLPPLAQRSVLKLMTARVAEGETKVTAGSPKQIKLIE